MITLCPRPLQPWTEEAKALTTYDLAGHSQAQQERLAYIELNLRFLGEIRRQSLIKRFQVKSASATRDLALYMALAPENLFYDASAKVYYIGAQFSALYRFSSDRVLTWLSQGFADGFPGILGAGVTTIQAPHFGQPNLETLSIVTRAIYKKTPLQIRYESLNGSSSRVIVPHTLVDNGLRWHVRGFDRKNGEFRDFVITRIIDPVALTNSPVLPHETALLDAACQHDVTLELVPHPDQPRPEVTRLDYGMIDGVVSMTVSAVIAGYTLRQWSVDCSVDHSLRGHEYRLWLRNNEVLTNVENSLLAPGYKK